jgi:hypothetical protein
MDRNGWIFIAVVATGLGLMVIDIWRSTPQTGVAPADPVELRVHAVPSARADDIRIALETSLSMGEGQAPLGRVSNTGQPGQLLILAPESIQDGIGAVIAELGKGVRAEPPMTADDTVILDVWSVDAVPEPGADDPSLAPVSAALEAARGPLGKVRFQQRDALSITGRSDGNTFRAQSPAAQGMLPFAVSATLSGIDGGVNARLVVLELGLETRVNLRFGEITVLTQAAAGDGRTRVLIARARPGDALN